MCISGLQDAPSAADAAADAAMARLVKFQQARWAYLYGRDRPHPISGVVPPRNRRIDAELAELLDAARAANRAAECLAANSRKA